MRISLFYHSLVSDWNHGNAHFLRGIGRQLLELGHNVSIYEPTDGWSSSKLVEQHGPAAAQAYREAYPELRSELFQPDSLDLTLAVGSADLVIVHEWNDPQLVDAIGSYVADLRRREGQQAGPRLLFHDTHHRIVSKPEEIRAYRLSPYDGVLAFGDIIRERYLESGYCRRAWTWHEAADTTVFRPIDGTKPATDLVWIGNWGDDERTDELREFLLEPVRRLGLTATVYGVRYPQEAIDALREAGIAYRGYLPNHRVPFVFAEHRVTVHVPRRPYARSLRGIPTIRPFEALACGIPLVSAPWQDTENLFRTGEDFLMVRTGMEMTDALEQVLSDATLARSLREHGLQTVRERHTCAHRAAQLMEIAAELGAGASAAQPARV